MKKKNKIAILSVLTILLNLMILLFSFILFDSDLALLVFVIIIFLNVSALLVGMFVRWLLNKSKMDKKVKDILFLSSAIFLTGTLFALPYWLGSVLIEPDEF